MEKKLIDDLRPVAHQHVAMLTAAGVPPAAALAISANVCALIYGAPFDYAIAKAFAAISASHADDELAEKQTAD